jgi:hypothetical protein
MQTSPSSLKPQNMKMGSPLSGQKQQPPVQTQQPPKPQPPVQKQQPPVHKQQSPLQ